MQRINQLLTDPATTIDAAKRQQSEPVPCERLSADSLAADSPLWDLWERMAETFGHRWSSQQGPAPNDTWVRACADLTGQQIATALAVIIERGGEWPPALPEFRQIALSGADPTAWERRCHKPISMDGLLENKTAAEKRKAEGRAQMRSLRAQIGL